MHISLALLFYVEQHKYRHSRLNRTLSEQACPCTHVILVSVVFSVFGREALEVPQKLVHCIRTDCRHGFFWGNDRVNVVIIYLDDFFACRSLAVSVFVVGCSSIWG